MKRLSFSFVVVCCLLVQETHAQKLADHLIGLTNETHIEVGILHQGNYENFAFRKRENHLRSITANPEAIFEAGSITKVFSAYMLQRVLESKPFTLNTNLSELPLEFSIHLRNEAKLINLINHTSGLQKMPMSYIWGMLKHPKNPYLVYNREKMISHYVSRTTPGSLGSSFNYSNFGYGMLGLIMEDLTGSSYEKLFERYIGKELSLSQTFVSDDIEGRIFKEEGCVWKLNQMKAMGGAKTSVDDLIKFARQVICKSDLDHSMAKALIAMEESTISINEVESFGQGWFLWENNGQKVLFHEGGSKCYRSFIGIDIENQTAIVLMSHAEKSNKNSSIIKQAGIDYLATLDEKVLLLNTQ